MLSRKFTLLSFLLMVPVFFPLTIVYSCLCCRLYLHNASVSSVCFLECDLVSSTLSIVYSHLYCLSYIHSVSVSSICFLSFFQKKKLFWFLELSLLYIHNSNAFLMYVMLQSRHFVSSKVFWFLELPSFWQSH